MSVGELSMPEHSGRVTPSPLLIDPLTEPGGAAKAPRRAGIVEGETLRTGGDPVASRLSRKR